MIIRSPLYLSLILSLGCFCTSIAAQNQSLELPSSPSAEMKKTKIKVIAFDFGGVIATTDKKEVAQFISKTLNLSPEQTNEALLQLKRYTKSGKEEQDFWLTYAQSMGIKLPVDWMNQLEKNRRKNLKEIPGMVNVVKNLQRQGFQTALLSNVRMSQARIKSELGLYQMFNPILLSYQTGFSKPDPQAYNNLLEQLKVPKEDVLFIDNKLENVQAAKSLGLDAILFIDADQLVEELKQRGIDVSTSS